MNLNLKQLMPKLLYIGTDENEKNGQLNLEIKQQKNFF